MRAYSYETLYTYVYWSANYASAFNVERSREDETTHHERPLSLVLSRQAERRKKENLGGPDKTTR